MEVKGKYMETTKAIHLRRSIRRYLPDPVDRELIKEILEDAMWAPSGVNHLRQFNSNLICFKKLLLLMLSLDKRNPD